MARRNPTRSRIGSRTSRLLYEVPLFDNFTIRKSHVFEHPVQRRIKLHDVLRPIKIIADKK